MMLLMVERAPNKNMGEDNAGNLTLDSCKIKRQLEYILCVCLV